MSKEPTISQHQNHILKTVKSENALTKTIEKRSPIPKWLLIAFLFFSFFPFLKILPIGTDIQPNAMVLGSVIVAIQAQKSFKNSKLTLLLVVSSIFICLLPYSEYHYDLIGVFRGFASTLSFAICICAWNAVEKKQLQSILSSNLIVTTLLVYTVAGLIQMYINPDLFTPVLSREFGYAQSDGRGVESLTAEPTYLAIQIFLIARVASVLSTKPMAPFTLGLTIFLIVFISKSSTVIATLGLAIGTAVIVQTFMISRVAKQKIKPHFLKIIIALGILFGFGISFQSSGRIEQTRIFNLIETMQKGGFDALYLLDQSVRDRLFAIESSLGMSIRDAFKPHGYGMYNAMTDGYQTKMLVTESLTDYNGRIMSGYGGAFFELGLFGLIPVILINKNLLRSHGIQSKVFWIVAVNLLLLQSVQLSNPLVAFLACRHGASDE